MPAAEKTEAILTVSQLNTLAKDILESSFAHVLVEGEISNLAQPRSGHIYFSLKDEKAQIRVALFAGTKRRLRFTPENGQKVMIKGKLSLFATRGDYQLIANMMEPAGEGDLRRQFEALKLKLEDLGWFSPERKKALPGYCNHLAVITSASGAAVRDIVHVLERRQPSMEITILPSLVQGNEACQQLCMAIEKANSLKTGGDPRFQFDAILLARGGGSLEDLWPFNEEALAKSIMESELPILSGVGHETDYTICDWVADLRAPTPSAAAEIISKDQKVIARQMQDGLEDLTQALVAHMHSAHRELSYLSKRLLSPKQKLQEQTQKVDFLEQQLLQNMASRVKAKEYQLYNLSANLHANSPQQLITLNRSRFEALRQRLHRQAHTELKNKALQFQFLVRQLNNLSPLNILERGYSISRIKAGKSLFISTEQKPAKVGQSMITELDYAQLESTITSVTPKPK